MTHYMNLNPSPFEMIASGAKTIELRLYDEKRRQIKVGDTIVFQKTSNHNEQITAEVIKLHKFNSFSELYEALPLDKCGYLPEEIDSASYKDMEEYYSAEKQAQYGVLGIEIKVVNVL